MLVATRRHAPIDFLRGNPLTRSQTTGSLFHPIFTIYFIKLRTNTLHAQLRGSSLYQQLHRVRNFSALTNIVAKLTNAAILAARDVSELAGRMDLPVTVLSASPLSNLEQPENLTNLPVYRRKLFILSSNKIDRYRSWFSRNVFFSLFSIFGSHEDSATVRWSRRVGPFLFSRSRSSVFARASGAYDYRNYAANLCYESVGILVSCYGNSKGRFPSFSSTILLVEDEKTTASGTPRR